jgi:Uma2 family endonuclease
MSVSGTDLTTTPAAPVSFHGRPLGRITVRMYEAMIAAGVFDEDDRFELIEGTLVTKMTKGWRHCRSSERCWRAIQAILPAGWHVEIEKPVQLPATDSMPEPDVSVVRGEVDDYEGRIAGPGDLGLVVEVSDSSLAADRALAATYLEGGIPAYWRVNVSDRQLEVYTPGAAGPAIVPESGSVELILDGSAVGRIAVAQLLWRS